MATVHRSRLLGLGLSLVPSGGGEKQNTMDVPEDSTSRQPSHRHACHCWVNDFSLRQIWTKLGTARWDWTASGLVLEPLRLHAKIVQSGCHLRLRPNQHFDSHSSPLHSVTCWDHFSTGKRQWRGSDLNSFKNSLDHVNSSLSCRRVNGRQRCFWLVPRDSGSPISWPLWSNLTRLRELSQLPLGTGGPSINSKTWDFRCSSAFCCARLAPVAKRYLWVGGR